MDRAQRRTPTPWFSPLTFVAATALVAALACRDAAEPASLSPAMAGRDVRVNTCVTPGNQKFQDEPEVFGGIFEAGQRAGCSYSVQLSPIAHPGVVLHPSYAAGLTTDPGFTLAFGWWDPDQAGACRSSDGSVAAYETGGIVSPELHGTGGVLGPPWSGNGGGTEAHCIRPGTYLFSASGSGGATSFPVDYIQTTGMLTNSTAGVTEWVERPYAQQGGVHDLVINVDVTSGGGGQLAAPRGVLPPSGSDTPVLTAQAVAGSPTDLATPFVGATSVSGTANTWFRFSMAGSSWTDDIPSWGHSGGRVLARLYWDAVGNPGDATGYYDADAYGPTTIRTHQYPNPLSAQQVYQVALDLKRPSEPPATSPPTPQVTVTINRIYPDLTPQAITPPAGATAGSSVNVGVTERNLNTTALGVVEAGWVGRLYLSTNTTFDAADVLVGSFSENQVIQPGAAIVTNRSITIPAGQASGAYYVLAVLDATGAILESNENNNTAASATTMSVGSAGTVDLSPGTVSFTPSTVSAGNSIAATVVERNLGSMAAPTGWQARLYLSADAVLSPATDALVDTYTESGSIAAAGSKTVNRTVTIPAGQGAGIYYLLAQLDATGTVGESNEANNAGASASQLTVTGASVTAPTGFVETSCFQTIVAGKTYSNHVLGWAASTQPAGTIFQILENGSNTTTGGSVTQSGPYTVFTATVGPYLKTPGAGPRYQWIRHSLGSTVSAWVPLASNPIQPKDGCLQ